jgi:hypothetical protein
MNIINYLHFPLTSPFLKKKFKEGSDEKKAQKALWVAEMFYFLKTFAKVDTPITFTATLLNGVAAYFLPNKFDSYFPAMQQAAQIGFLCLGKASKTNAIFTLLSMATYYLPTKRRKVSKIFIPFLGVICGAYHLYSLNFYALSIDCLGVYHLYNTSQARPVAKQTHTSSCPTADAPFAKASC